MSATVLYFVVRSQCCSQADPDLIDSCRFALCAGGTLTAFSEILGEPLADANSKISVMARTRLFAHGLRQLVMIHMKGLTDVSAEALPAEAELGRHEPAILGMQPRALALFDDLVEQIGLP